ncbi:MAG: phospholipase D family protein [Myxococcales bacterium]|jgi:HKD family nuclease|nr:phospholipase D family protein [Myxococcales bacterium]
MKLHVLKNRPLRPLADRARTMAECADEVWIATAFVSQLAVDDIVGSAVHAGAQVRFLTGTFGKVTRSRTFEAMFRLSDAGTIRVRVWHGDYHAKLFLFRKGTSATAWVGSANLSDRGLQDEGELVVEFKGRWNDVQFRQLRRAFDADWKRSSQLDQAFLRSYREAPRSGAWLTSSRQVAPVVRRKHRAAHTRGVMLVAPVSHHYSDDSATAKRVDRRLGGAETWYRSSSSRLRLMRADKLALLSDSVDGTLSVVVATDQIRDRKGWVFAHRPFSRKGERNSTVRLRRALSQLGLSTTARSFRTQWLDRTTAEAVVELLYGTAARRRLQRALG